MRIVTEHRFVLITGMARSGTTLLASLLNSAENTAILSEPHNSLCKNGYFWTDKLSAPGERSRIPVEQIVPFLRDTRRYDLTGVKEVCEPIPAQDGMFLDYAMDAADLVLVMVRDPVDTIASQRQIIHFTLAQSLVILSKFMGWADRERKRRNLRFVRYDLLCADPLGYLNALLARELRIEGALAKLPMRGFGDSRALESAEVRMAQSRRDVLSPGEVLAIEAVAGDWFEELGYDRAPTAAERAAQSMITSQRRFRYVRVGHDSRVMEFLPDGTVGEGCAACEQSWYLREDFRGMLTFVLIGGDTVTCRLRREEDGVWRGRWLDHERMPIELIPVRP